MDGTNWVGIGMWLGCVGLVALVFWRLGKRWNR